MTGTFRPEPEASAKLEHAALWYEGQRPGLGLELVQAVDSALAEITLALAHDSREPGYWLSRIRK